VQEKKTNKKNRKVIAGAVREYIQDNFLPSVSTVVMVA